MYPFIVISIDKYIYIYIFTRFSLFFFKIIILEVFKSFCSRLKGSLFLLVYGSVSEKQSKTHHMI